MNIVDKIFVSIAEKIKIADKRKQKVKEYKKNKQELDKNEKLNNSQSGRCFIFGNGPSIKNIDFGQFENEDVFVVNLIANHVQFKKLKPKYYVMVDPFLLSAEDSNKDRIDKVIEVGKNNPGVKYFFPTKVQENYYCRIIEKNSEIYFLKSVLRLIDFMNDDPSLSKSIPDYGNVVLYAIYIAICLGYKAIYLLGCDETSILTLINAHRGYVDDSAYGYHLSEEEKKRIISTSTILPFDKSLSIMNETFKDFSLMKKYGEKYDVKIYNCCKESLLKCYDFIALEDVLQ